MFVRSTEKDTVRVPSGSVAWKQSDRALRLIVHESLHTYQFDLIRRLEAGEIRRDDPRYVQTLLFLLNFKGQRDVSLYLTGLDKQPVERHAKTMARDVIAHIKRSER